MAVRNAVVAGLFGAAVSCSFPGSAPENPDAGSVDAATDAEPVLCEPGELRCSGRELGTCNAEGDGFDDVTCDFTCADLQCAKPSNLSPESLALCESAAVRLSPPPGATVTISTGPQVSCDPDCGDAGTIDPIGTQLQPDGPPLAIFCLTDFSIPADVDVEIDRSSDVVHALVFVVDGAVAIDGSLSVAGDDATEALFGRGGPGGGGGGPFGQTEGNPGKGACGGQTGERAGSAGDYGPGGGGGGGMSAAGGPGGEGRNPSGNDTGDGGAGGGECGTAALIPLLAGSGGAGGPDGTCGAECGWPGGGGGGALQISSRTSIAVAGGLSAAGGQGFGFLLGTESGGGGGGGGSGGAILLEAPAISVGGTIDVEGGRGGAARAGIGGAGGDGVATLAGGGGANQDDDGEAGAGGGGAAGRLRLRSTEDTQLCAAPAPTMSCSAALLSDEPLVE